MEFTELLQKRTCIRSYTDTPVTKEQMHAILEAGVRAPNACNFQSWHFYAVCDKALIDGFYPDIARIPWIANISLVIVVCMKDEVVNTLTERFGERGRMFAIQDSAGAVNHMLLRAADLGLGGCWIGPMDVEKCKSHLHISEDHTPVAILTIGTPSADMPLRDRKTLEEVVTVIGDLPNVENKEGAGRENKPFSIKHASLPDAAFTDLNLAGATFDNIYMANALFNNICLEGTRFIDINMTKTSYGGLNLSQSHFGCVDFNNATFENPCFDGSTFKNCSFKGVCFENCEFDATIITKDGEERQIK